MKWLHSLSERQRFLLFGSLCFVVIVIGLVVLRASIRNDEGIGLEVQKIAFQL
jgi:hypothetical protein